MADLEQARAEVQARRIEDAHKALRKRLNRLLPGPTRRTAMALFGETPLHFRGSDDPTAIVAMVEELSAKRRAKLFQTISPHMVDVLGWRWEDDLQAPYQIGHTRKTFRAPGDVAVTARSRVHRLQGLARWSAMWDAPVVWLAQHGGHVDPTGTLGSLLASTLDHAPTALADEVAGHLVDQVNGRGVPGAMGRHAPIAMLGANRPDLWDEVAELLLGAQRQEGVRQSILEAVDLAHPDAFAKFLSLIAEHGLTRFAATARAVGVWFGEPFEARDRKLLDGVLAQVAPMLAAPATARAAAGDAEAPTARLGLWAMAARDARASAGVARTVLGSDDPALRLVAARHLADLGPMIDADGILGALADDDERVRAVAFDAVRHWAWQGGPVSPASMDALRTLLDRQPTATKVPIGTWKPVESTLDPKDIADLTVGHLAGQSPLILEPLVPSMSPNGRASWARALAENPTAHRRQLLELIGDRAEYPRRIALDALEKTRLDPAEAPDLEAMLTRSTADLRRGALLLLLSQPDEAAVASAARLMEGKKHQQTAGRELAEELRKARRGGTAVQALLAEGNATAAVAGEKTWADVAAETRAGVTAPAPAPGPPAAAPVASLVDHAARTPAIRPEAPEGAPTKAQVAATALAITSLEAWLAEHADLEVRVGHAGGESNVVLLSNVRWIQRLLTARPFEEQAARLPLPDVVDPWWERTRPNLDPDGAGLVLAVATLGAVGGVDLVHWYPGRHADPPAWATELADRFPAAAAARGERAPVTQGLLTWVAAREATPVAIGALLDVVEATLAEVPSKVVRKMPTAWDLGNANHQNRPDDWRDQSVVTGPVGWATKLEALRPDLFTATDRGRLVRVVRWLDEPHRIQPNPSTKVVKSRYRSLPDREVPLRPTRRPLPLRLACRAVDDGAAQVADVVELLVGDRCPEDQRHWQPWDENRQPPLSEATRRALPTDLAGHAWLGDEVDRVRDNILDIELRRGELPTHATEAAAKLRTMIGAERVLDALAALGSQSFVRGYVWGGRDSKKHSFSKLVRIGFPGPDDDAERFASLAKARKIKPAKLVDLAVYAPQWASLVEQAIDRPGLADAIRWLHAHTKDDRWQVDADVRAEWMAQVHEQTPLTAEDLVAGTVDVAWFGRIREALGDEHFTSLLKAAKYASSSGGHKRAELFAKALRAEVDVEAIQGRAEEKRHQDSVRAVGLVPLPSAADAAKAEVLSRWTWLQQWAKGSRQFGQQKRASEALAVRVATDNLARTAGYADPQRLTWAMEAEAVRDLAAGPLVATAEDVTVTLSIDADGAPVLAVDRAGKSLKNVPKKVAKDEAIAELKDRARVLREQARRMRRSLEEAMVRGDAFTTAEFDELREHAVLRPMLDALVVVDEDGATGRSSDAGLRGADGKVVKPRGGLRIAHPNDLLHSGTWHDWQHLLFTEKVRQPCKQVFRELYVLTQAERDAGHRSKRYAGQQVQPAQASGLFGARGWVVSPEGEVLKTFHDHDITAHVTVWLGAYGTPAEVEDAPIEDLLFTRRGSWDPVALVDVPPRLFSEVMRDLDLVVSVAHSGGYDPEASASSIEVRGAIVRETAELLSLDNVEVTDNHAMVKGSFGSYSVHLGSGTVHKRPGNAVCIIPIGAQQRGRIFLPFVDDDPRTAEIVSKVVLLARDDKIKDPSILDQLR